MYANASCKAGTRKNDLPVYDFMLDVENMQMPDDSEESIQTPIDETYIFNQIIFYLKSIQTND
jgi:hypothetical protein